MKTKTTLRRVLSVLLCVVMIACLMPTSFAASAPVIITGQPVNVTVNEGETAVFTVTASGTGLSYQWQFTKSGEWKNCTSTTSGYNTDTLKPVGTAARNGYQYRCIVTDANGNTATSNAAKLTVKASAVLAITTQPANATVNEGESASFKVVATGTGLTYQWQYKSASATTWKNCTSTTAGYNTAALKPVGTAARNGYSYRCVITDANGNSVTSNAAKLTVKASAALAITSQPANATVNEGESASFKVTATGTGLTYQWQFSKSGTEWKNCTSTTAGYNTATLKPVGTAARNGYNYRCIVTDASGKTVTSNAAKLTVKASATLAITTQPANATVSEGGTASFKVVATGTGLSYQWQYKTSSGTTWKSCTSTTAGYNTDTLKPVGTAARNGYSYRCVITDASGKTVTSNAAKLTVKSASALAITAQPANVTVSEGSTASFKVVATGTGLSYQWQYKTSSGTTWKNCTSTTEGYNTDTLKPVGTAARNGYSYRCIVTDANGNTVTSDAATLTVTSVTTELVIVDQTSSNVIREGETYTFTVVAEGTGLKYQWQYSTDGGTSWVNTSSAAGKTATLSGTAKASDNNNYYRCIVTDVSGKSVTSKSAILFVKSSAPLTITRQPENVAEFADDITYFTLRVTGGEPLYTYRWQYASPDSNGAYSEWTNIESSDSWAQYPYYMTARLGIKWYTDESYRYRCVITDEVGNKVISDAVGVTAEQKVYIKTQPQNTEVTELENFTFAVEVDGGLQPYSYEWQYSTNDGTVWTDFISASSRTAALSEKAPLCFNNYLYRCIVTDAYGNKVTSDSAKLTVIADPSAPLTIAIQPVSVDKPADGLTYFTVAATGGKPWYYFRWEYTTAGNEDDKYAWRFLDGSTDWAVYPDCWTARLAIKNHADRNYVYRCVITDEAGNRVVSDIVEIIEKYPLTVTTQPKTVRAKDGDSVTFSIEVAEGAKPYTYAWQYRFRNSTTHEYYDWQSVDDDIFLWKTGTDTPTMTTRVSWETFEGSYCYRCLITDAQGNTVATDQAYILQALSIKDQPENAVADVGDRATFHVYPQGGTWPYYNYEWQYRWIPLGSSTYTKWYSVPTDTWAHGADSDLLYFTVGLSDFQQKMQFRCVVTDEEGTKVISNAATVKKKTLDILWQPQDVYAAVGDTVSFTVTPFGANEVYSYRWRYRYIPEGSDTYTDWIDCSYKAEDWASDTESQTLKIVVKDDEFERKYQYYCDVYNRVVGGWDHVYSDIVQVISKAPVITMQPADILASAGDYVSFNVEATGGTAPYSYEWQYRWIPDPDGSGTYNEWSDIGDAGWASGTYTDTLSFSVGSSEFKYKYQYRCVITGADGYSVTSKSASILQK